MLESMKKVEAKRAENAVLEPRRMTAEEKDTLLASYHPDYKKNEFESLLIGANKGERYLMSLPRSFRERAASPRTELISPTPITTSMCS